MAVEDMAGIKPPPRAQYIRTIVAELERIHSHFLWLGLAGHFIGYNTVWMWVWRYREPILDLFEIIVGNRNHYAVPKVGGARRDIQPEDYPRIERVLNQLEEKTRMFTGAVLDDPVIRARLENVGVLTQKDAVAYGVVGPIARGSGVAIDVRKDEPYDAYDQVSWDMIIATEGDILAKAKIRLLECFESIKIIRQCLERIPSGPIATRVDQNLIGEGIGRHEAPRGEVIHYVRGDGSNMPIRHKIRAPSYMNIAANVVAVKGYSIADAALVLAAMDPCYCCTERTGIYEDGRRIMRGPDLLKLSRAKTEKIVKERKF
jgi:NADH-quinone oxidoreductase subunit D